MSKVAVIEDDDALGGSLRQLFEAEGSQAVLFPDPPPVEELARFSPDLIVLDCILTTMSGPDYLKALRDHPGLEQVPVIVTTGYDELYESLVGLESESVAVLKKPLSVATIRETARKLKSGV